MTIPDVIAQLNSIENELDAFKMRLRTLRHDLVETLDQDPTLW